MADIINMQELADAKLDAGTLEEVVNGSDTADVVARLGRTYPTLAKALKIISQAGGAKAYATLSEATAATLVLDANTPVYVWGDTNNNGNYLWDGTTLTKSDYDPVLQAKAYTDNETLQISNDDFTSHFKDKAYVNTNTGAEVATQNGLLTKYIKVSKNDVINLYAVTTNANVAKVAYYDENKVFIRADSDSNATASLKHYPVAQDGYVRCFSRTETDPNYSLTITRDFGKTEVLEEIGNPMQIPNENLSNIADNTTPTTTANVSYVVDGTTIAVTSTNTAVGTSNISWYLYDLTAINLAISLTKAILTTAGILLRVRFRDSENNVLASTDISPILQSDGTYTYSSEITAPSSYYSIAIALMMQNAPQGTITFDANNLILIDKDAQLPTTDEYIDNRVLKKTNPISARVTALENKDIPDRSLFDQYVQKGLIINTADKLIETTLQTDFISWWGSSSVMFMHPFLQTMAADLGITNIINGGKGSETAEKHAARMGAVPAKCLVVGGVITASTPITINDFGTRPDSLLAYTGTLNGVTGTLSYAQATEPRYLFTRTDSSADVSVSPTQVYEFIPDYDPKFMQGTVILNVGKNSITDGKNAEYVMQYTDAMYNYVKNYFKRVLIINHYSNQSYTATQRNYIAAYNSALVQKYGNRVVDNYAYLMSGQAFTDLNLTPTTADVTAMGLGVIPPSLTSDGIHMKDAVSQKFVENVLKVKLTELWY